MLRTSSDILSEELGMQHDFKAAARTGMPGMLCTVLLQALRRMPAGPTRTRPTNRSIWHVYYMYTGNLRCPYGIGGAVICEIIICTRAQALLQIMPAWPVEAEVNV